jgi:imidazolonepropionase-like amidohydrolase
VSRSAKTLFTNANLVLDGFAELQKSFDVLVQGNRILSVSQTPIDHQDAKVIDVRGRTLLPGLIDAHAHITGLSLSPKNIAYPPAEISTAAANYLRCSLMDGFTSIREAGGADHNIARLLADGKIIGPRLFYSGRALTQTGGGADFRTPDEVFDPCGQPGPFSVMSVIADGIDEVRKAAREELRRGATQLKVFVSGGVVFPSEAHPTIYEYSLDELRDCGRGEGPRHLRHGARLYR